MQNFKSALYFSLCLHWEESNSILYMDGHVYRFSRIAHTATVWMSLPQSPDPCGCVVSVVARGAPTTPVALQHGVPWDLVGGAGRNGYDVMLVINKQCFPSPSHPQMKCTGIPELTSIKHLDYLKSVMVLDRSEEQVADHFRQQIQECPKKAWSTQINWLTPEHFGKHLSSFSDCAVCPIHNTSS